MEYKVLLFDADNTLFDYTGAEANSLKNTFAKFGLPYSEAILHKYRVLNSEVWHQHEQGRISKAALQTARFERLFEFLGVSCNASDFNSYYLTLMGKNSQLLDSALEVCKTFCQTKKLLYIVTNGLTISQSNRFEHSEIKPYIKDIFISEKIGVNKPDIAFFDYVFSHIPFTKKEDILIIGDSLTADIAGGINAGIDTCWYNPYKQQNNTQFKPKYEINTLKELYKIVN